MTPKQIQQATIAALKERGIEVDPKITITDLVPIVEQASGTRRHFTCNRSDYLSAFLSPAKVSAREPTPFRPMLRLPEDLRLAAQRVVGMPILMSMASRVPK